MRAADHLVVYTDPAWLVRDGTVDPALATIEREVLGDGVALVAGPHDGARYPLDGPELHARVAGAGVLVVYRCPVTPALLDAAGPGLRGVIRQGVGVDNLAAELLAERGIPGYNVPDYCVDEVATHTAAMALALERRLLHQHRVVAGGRFDIYAGGIPGRINRRTLGVVGFGRIGRAVTRRLGAFYGEVVVYDPYVGRDLAEAYGGRAVDTLGELLGSADLVTLHCPLTPETRGLLGEAEFALLRPGAYLVNTARGALVDPAALARALAEGRLGGAGLDVFDPDNPSDDPRWRAVLASPDVVLSSHRAFLSTEAAASSRRRVAETARELLAGRRPVLGRVTP